VVLIGCAAVVLALRTLVFDRSSNDAGTQGNTVEQTGGELLAAVKTDLSGVTRLEPGKSGTFDAIDAAGGIAAHVVDTRGMPGIVDGYGGRVPVAIMVSDQGRITSIRILGNSETPSYLDRVVGAGLLAPFIGKTPAEAVGLSVDAVSGATYSSQGLLSSIRAGLSSIQSVSFTQEKPQTDLHVVAKKVAAAVVLLIGLVCAIGPKKFRRFRPGLMVADVVVLGFVGGVMLSTAQFAAWISGGPGLPTGIVPFSAFIIAALFPLVTGRRIWCDFMCPYGAASELMSMIPVRKFRAGPTVRKIAGYAGLLYLCMLVGVLVVWPDLDLASFEPFAAFSLLAAPVASLIIAVLFLLVSAVCPKFWCRFLCPTGRILDLFSFAGKKTARPADHGETPSEGGND